MTKHIFTGLSGFPITPLRNGQIDFTTLTRIRDHLDQSGLDSIGVLGSTGSFAYLDESRRAAVMECWSAVKTPWIAGVSATTTAEAIRGCKVAHRNGASGVIANAHAYVPLSDAELEGYFLAIADASELPLCVYDNPINTGRALSIDVLARLSRHPNIQGAKVFADLEAHAQLSKMDWYDGYARDWDCPEVLIAGGQAWYSTLAGTVPEYCVPIMQAIRAGNHAHADQLTRAMQPVWELMQTHTGYRVVHGLANARGWTCQLPKPLTLPEVDWGSYLPQS